MKTSWGGLLRASVSGFLVLGGCYGNTDLGQGQEDGDAGSTAKAGSSGRAEDGSIGGQAGTGGSGLGGKGGTDPGGSGPGGAGGEPCKAPIDEETLAKLSLGMVPSLGEALSLQPGAIEDFDLGTMECCYTFEPKSVCASYSVNPDVGATIDPGTGVLHIASSVASGSMFKVTADVENGRKLVTADVCVYTPEANPLVGSWSEQGQIPCSGGPTVSPSSPIGELRFTCDGEFHVTWQPFEVYEDYWGSYTFDLDAGTITLTVDSGNYVPPDVDGQGTFTIEQGKLVLHDLWLGSPENFHGEVACGHLFQ